MRAILKLIPVAMKSALGGGTLPLLAVAVALSVVTGAYFKGASVQKVKCRAVEYRQTIDELTKANERLKRQASLADEARTNAIKRSIADAEKNEKKKAEADELKRQILQHPGRCPISPSDAQRLRRIGR